MRMCVILAALVLAATAIPADAQTGPPHVTASAAGPTLVYPGSDATFDITVEVDGPESDLYITWGVSGQRCCDHVSSSVVSGRANRVGDASPSSVRWSVYGPKATIRLVLHIQDSLQAGPVTIGGYLPGTDVAQYLSVNGWEAQVARLPQTGGRPATAGPSVSGLIISGLASLVLSGLCFGAAVPQRKSGYN